MNRTEGSVGIAPEDEVLLQEDDVFSRHRAEFGQNRRTGDDLCAGSRSQIFNGSERLARRDDVVDERHAPAPDFFGFNAVKPERLLLLSRDGMRRIGNGIPYVGLSVRRMHDIGKRGYWAALNFVPAVLSIGVWFLAVIAGLSCFWAQEELWGSELETFYLIICIVMGLVLIGYFLICLVCVGVFIWLCCKKSQPETNQWGPCPAFDVKADYVSSAESTETKSE